jgi:hypothetical protein
VLRSSCRLKTVAQQTGNQEVPDVCRTGIARALLFRNREKITTLSRCGGEDANPGERRSGVKKKSDRNRWVMHVPVLSTSHIKQETLNNLGPEFQVLNMKESAFVWIGPNAYASANTPEELKSVIRWMNNTYPKEWWVRFDRDGDVIPELPAFEW